jgi:hypothetical protein
LKSRNMIDRVTEGQEPGRTAGPDDYRLDKASRGDLGILPEAAVAAMGCIVLVDEVVAVGEAENCIGYVRLQAVLEGKAAVLHIRLASNPQHVPESLASNTKRGGVDVAVAVSAAAVAIAVAVAAAAAAKVKMSEDGPAVQASRGTVAWSDLMYDDEEEEDR